MATLHPPAVDAPSTVAPPAREPNDPASNDQWPQQTHPSADPDPVKSVPNDEQQLYGHNPTSEQPQDLSNQPPTQGVVADRLEQTPPNPNLYQQQQDPQPQHHFHQYPHQPNAAQHPQNTPQQEQQGPAPPSAGAPAPAAANSPGSKIFVGGLSWETGEDSLRRYFEQIGTVLDCVIMRDRHTGHPRGFGFVTFADDEAAENAASRRHDLDGRQVEAKRAVPRSEGGGGGGGGGSSGGGGGMGGGGGGQGGNVFGPGARAGAQQQAGSRFSGDTGGQAMHGGGGGGHRAHHTTKCKVFVGGLPSSCGVDDFRAYFSRFGDVIDAQVMIDHNTGNSRGFGFVTFANEAIVNTVVGPGKSNTNHEIMGKCVEVKRAEPKGAPSDRRNNRDNYNSAGGRGGGTNNESNANGANNAAAAAAAAYYSNYPASLAEQYGAYYNSPQWQQYYAAMGYNFNAYPQGYNPYQQYLQAYMNNAATAANGASGAGAAAIGSGGGGDGNAGGGGGGGNSGSAGGGNSGANSAVYDNPASAGGRYGGGGGGDVGPNTPQNGHGGGGGGGAGSRRSSRRDERYHPYR